MQAAELKRAEPLTVFNGGVYHLKKRRKHIPLLNSPVNYIQLYGGGGGGGGGVSGRRSGSALNRASEVG